MIYLKYIRTYNQVFFFKEKPVIKDGEVDEFAAYTSEPPSTMVRIFETDFTDGAIYSFDNTIKKEK